MTSDVALSRRATLEVWVALASYLDAIEHEPGPEYRALLDLLDVARRSPDALGVRFAVLPSNVEPMPTQRELAKTHRVTERTIRRWERDGRLPTREEKRCQT